MIETYKPILDDNGSYNSELNLPTDVVARRKEIRKEIREYENSDIEPEELRPSKSSLLGYVDEEYIFSMIENGSGDMLGY